MSELFSIASSSQNDQIQTSSEDDNLYNDPELIALLTAIDEACARKKNKNAQNMDSSPKWDLGISPTPPSQATLTIPELELLNTPFEQVDVATTSKAVQSESTHQSIFERSYTYQMQPPSPHSHESLASPLYLNSLSLTMNAASDLQDSQTPQEFLSNSTDIIPTIVEHQPQKQKGQVEQNGVDDIDMLMQLLGLSNCGGGESQSVCQKLGCDDAFYANVVGLKGMRSDKEVERLDGWIKYYLNAEKDKRQPLVLAYLLLGKAAIQHSNDGIGDLDFPSTIDDFLQNDPPMG